MIGWDVFLDGELIDTVFYDHDLVVDEEYVLRSLTQHDGYPSRITVKCLG